MPHHGNDTLLRWLARITSKYYMKREDYTEPLLRFFRRLGWLGLAREGLAHANFLLDTEKAFIMPRLVRFEVTNHCNLKCKMCPQPTLMKREKRYMDVDLFQKVVANTPQIREIDLFNWGEPLLHPKLHQFIAYAASRNIYTRIVTNGTLLNAAKSRMLLDSGLNEILFSLDNIGLEYEQIRGVPYKKTIENIEAFLNMAKNIRHHIRTGINIVASPFNSAGIDSATKAFGRLGVDSILIEKCQFHDIDYERSTRCFELYRNMCVLSNGQVVPCCVDFEGVLSVGSAYAEPNLNNIFNNSNYLKLRHTFTPNAKRMDICRKCHYRTVSFNI